MQFFLLLESLQKCNIYLSIFTTQIFNQKSGKRILWLDDETLHGVFSRTKNLTLRDLSRFLGILLFLSLVNCSTHSKANLPVPPSSQTLYWDEVAELLAAVPLSEGNRFVALTKHSKYSAYQKKIDKYWRQEKKNYIDKVEPWRDQHIEDAYVENTVLYPLSGADFINLYHFHPNAKRFIMIGLQNPGHIEDPLSINFKNFLTVLPNLESLVYELSVFNYYTSKRLNRDSNHPHISGVAPVLFLFLKRLGFTISDFKQVYIDAQGKELSLVEQENPRIADLPGIKIQFFKKGENTLRELSFYKILLNNSSGDSSSPEGKYLQSQGRLNLILKSAEYILHTEEFSDFIQSLVKKTDRVIEDESGIPLRLFPSGEWSFKVYGKYVGRIPLKKTPKVPFQLDLALLFQEEKPEVLPFHFGYGVLRGKGKSNLIFLKRK